MTIRVLILAGTPEARNLANLLANRPELEITSAYAGVAQRQVEPQGKIRVGGFGGALGFAKYLEKARVDCVINAAHPFAKVMTQTAQSVCQYANVPYLRLRRPQWNLNEHKQIREFNNLDDLINKLPEQSRPYVTLGRDWRVCAKRNNISFLIRVLRKPLQHPVNTHFIEGISSDDAKQEIEIFKNFGITHLITKNSGGRRGLGKLYAARAVGAAIFLIRRPSEDPAVTCVCTPEVAVDWLTRSFKLP